MCRNITSTKFDIFQICRPARSRTVGFCRSSDTYEDDVGLSGLELRRVRLEEREELPY